MVDKNVLFLAAYIVNKIKVINPKVYLKMVPRHSKKAVGAYIAAFRELLIRNKVSGR